MRIMLFLVLAVLGFAQEFPKIFASVGDDVYANMLRFEKIKDLKIYKDRPELLEAFCIDANATLQEGLRLEAKKDDPEVILSKENIKAYAKKLRVLSKKNDAIMTQLDRDVTVLREAKDYETLAKISEAGFVLSSTILAEIDAAKKKAKMTKQAPKPSAVMAKKSVPAATSTSVTSNPATSNPAVVNPAPKPTVAPSVPVVIPPALEPEAQVKEAKSEPVPEKKPLSELEQYELSLANLKEELYALRESSEQEKMACMNDITAINYWMIRVLKSEQNACDRADAIKQMKSYAKASATTCGRTSMRYIEWQARIKPYVGAKLFQAEADCHR